MAGGNYSSSHQPSHATTNSAAPKPVPQPVYAHPPAAPQPVQPVQHIQPVHHTEPTPPAQPAPRPDTAQPIEQNAAPVFENNDGASNQSIAASAPPTTLPQIEPTRDREMAPVTRIKQAQDHDPHQQHSLDQLLDAANASIPPSTAAAPSEAPQETAASAEAKATAHSAAEEIAAIDLEALRHGARNKFVGGKSPTLSPTPPGAAGGASPTGETAVPSSAASGAGGAPTPRVAPIPADIRKHYTGGIQGEDGNTDAVMAGAVLDQVQEALVQADVIVFLVDGRQGLTGADEEVANIIRKVKKPILLAVNKIDSMKDNNNVMEFYKLGLGEPLGLSAMQGSGGVGDLLDAIVEKFPEGAGKIVYPEEGEEEKDPNTSPYAIAVVGRPNVDASIEISDQDQKIAGKIEEAGKAAVIVINKWDLIEDRSSRSMTNFTEEVKRQLRALSYAEVVFTSATSKLRVPKILEATARAYAEAHKRITTGLVNQIVNESVALVPPPASKRVMAS
ncbi:unnamed protein product [Rotaria sordida]|uniref:Tr-type G domain-containing protein n=1 Tax=Rotaria sordida TaxID=392033 RepID=A0A813PJU1_9BILA|nr:unnamed protein product [Rotaria sordida]